jgi:hypothetical protein
VVATVLPSLGSPNLVLGLGIRLLTTGLVLFVLLRVGLLALMALTLFLWLGRQIGTLDPGSWVGSTSMINLAVLLVVAALAGAIALGGRGFLQEEV